jgi:hypothetical protein
MKLLLQRHGNSKRQTERPSHLPTPRGDLHGQRGGQHRRESGDRDETAARSLLLVIVEPLPCIDAGHFSSFPETATSHRISTVPRTQEIRACPRESEAPSRRSSMPGPTHHLGSKNTSPVNRGEMRQE